MEGAGKMNDMANDVRLGYYPEINVSSVDDDDMAPYASLFQKPFATNKSLFTRKELEAMCKDPLHSPKLIIYLIDMVKGI